MYTKKFGLKIVQTRVRFRVF